MASEILTEIDIAAPPARVWAVLTDFARFPEWTSFLKVLAGRPEPGTKLSVRIAPPGVMAMTLAPRVLRADANREFRWLGSLLVPGIFDGEHFFQVEANGTGTRFRHGEHFRGLLVPLVMRGKMLAATRAGFAAFNADLKLRTESNI